METKLKATPGPWLVTTTPTGKGKVTDSDGFSICNTTAGSTKQQMRDAYLIAAAPDLYAALEYIITWNQKGWSAENARKLAIEALAKARGES